MRPGPRGGGDCPPHLLPPAPRPYQTERTPSGPQSSVSRVPRGRQQPEIRFQNGIILHANSTLETPGHLPIGLWLLYFVLNNSCPKCAHHTHWPHYDARENGRWVGAHQHFRSE